MNLSFEWDEIKEKANFKKHKVSFAEGKTIFNDPLLFTFPDYEHSATEERYVNIGLSAQGHVLVLTHTERRGNIVSLVAGRPPRVKGNFMKKANKETADKNDMRPEYDFSSMKGGVRGKYHKAYRAGHKVVIHQEDGTTSVQHFKLEDGAVMIEPDVRKYFPNSESVNKALRSLLAIIPTKRRSTAHTK